jgi:hypothetical protein
MRPKSPPALHQTPVRRRGGTRALTLIEVLIALAAFTLAGSAITISYAMINTRATRIRCDSVASAILRAKVAKALTDPWLPQAVPVDCVVTNGQQLTTADPNDPYDVGPTVVLLTSNDEVTPLVTGKIYRNTQVFEAAAKTVTIDYQITYSYRGRQYNVYASTVRAEDK